jgi:ethanolamine utilization protein EutQ (cupin superfamily)
MRVVVGYRADNWPTENTHDTAKQLDNTGESRLFEWHQLDQSTHDPKQRGLMSVTVTKQISFGQKLAFGFGMWANQMFPAALGVENQDTVRMVVSRPVKTRDVLR